MRYSLFTLGRHLRDLTTMAGLDPKLITARCGLVWVRMRRGKRPLTQPDRRAA